MTKKPIHQVAADVLAKAGRPMTAKEIYDAIVRDGLYEFQAKDPASIVRSQLRKHSVNVKSPGAVVKSFRMTDKGLFTLLDPAD